jgi:hypothetical protein
MTVAATLCTCTCIDTQVSEVMLAIAVLTTYVYRQSYPIAYTIVYTIKPLAMNPAPRPANVTPTLKQLHAVFIYIQSQHLQLLCRSVLAHLTPNQNTPDIPHAMPCLLVKEKMALACALTGQPVGVKPLACNGRLHIYTVKCWSCVRQRRLHSLAQHCNPIAAPRRCCQAMHDICTICC